MGISGRVSNSGNKCVVSNFTPAGANNILVSKRVVPAIGDSLVFYFKQTFWNVFKDTFKVLVSGTDSLFSGTPAVLLNFIDGQNYPVPSGYGRYTASLNSFAGQTVWLGFQHLNVNGDNIRLDDISVGQNGPPVITFDSLFNINNLSNRILTNVGITDSEGVDTTSGKKPRIYFKRMRDANTSEGWKFTEANNNISPFEFTIDYSLLSEINPGDTIQYFVVAQEIKLQPKVGINSGTFASPPQNVALTSAAFPIGGVINSYKINDAPAISYSVLTSKLNARGDPPSSADKYK
ncbi:MAG: choice-of-anchor J domain-containing protein [Ignavibacteria bacterium]|nr:choice-of-anchor J domain-containing protein [Ignavibacteria bacterium]